MTALSAVASNLAQLGVHLTPEYIAAVLQQEGRQGDSVEEQLRYVYAQFLTADLNTCGTGCLPADLPARHASVLQGRFVLQIDEAIDTIAPAKLRHARGQFVPAWCCCKGPSSCQGASMLAGIMARRGASVC